MPQKTNLHNWKIPVEDDISPEDRDQWGGLLTEFFDKELDGDVSLEGPVSDRPLASDYPGLMFVVTDSDPSEITRSTGTGYEVIGTTDAETLDGVSAEDFAQLADDETVTGTWTFDNQISIPSITGGIVGGDSLTSVLGDNLVLNQNGVLNAIDTDTDTRTDVSEAGVQIQPDVTDINFASNLNVSDDGDGSVTVDAIDTDTDTDTRTNVSDDGTQIVANTTDINFGTNLPVSDDGDGSVTVDASGSATDTRTDVSDDGTTIVTDTTDINFGTDLDAIDDGDGSVTINSTASSGGSGTSTTLYMSDYAVPGNGVPDGDDFENAVTDAQPGDTIVFDHGTYLFDSAHTVTKPLTIKFVDATLKYTNTANNNAAILFEGGGITDSTYIRNDLTPGDRTMLMNGNSIYSPGDTVLIMEGTYASNINAKMQFARVESVDTDTENITIDGGVHTSFASVDTNVYVVDLLDSPTFEGVETFGGGNRHLQFRWCETPTFRDCRVSEYLEVSLYALDCWKPRWYDVEAREPLGLASGEGEPLACYRCSDAYIESPRIEHCRRGIDFAWGSHNCTIVDPVIRGVSLVGIGIHQNDFAGHFSIVGGEVVCDPEGQSGHCIAMSETTDLSMSGTRLVARDNAIIADHEMEVSDVTIEAVDSTANTVGIHVLGGSGATQFDNIQINDPDGRMQYPVWIDSQGNDIEFCKCDVHIRYPGSNAILVDARDSADTIEFVTLTGSINATGGSPDQAMFIRSDTGFIQAIDVSMTFRNVAGGSGQAVRLYNESGTLKNIDFHNCYIDCELAAIFTDGSGIFGTIKVSDSTFNTGGTSLSFNEPVEKLFITNNDVSGSIDSTGANAKRVAGNI